MLLRTCAKVSVGPGATSRRRSRPSHPWRAIAGIVIAFSGRACIQGSSTCTTSAPTEILAEQHFRKLVQWLQPLGVQVAWLTGSRRGKARSEMVERVASGEAMLVVGTHAVIQHDVAFARLGPAIVTKVFADSRRAQVGARIRDEVAQGKQVYWVCPLVEESEHLDLQNATATHAELGDALLRFADLQADGALFS